MKWRKNMDRMKTFFKYAIWIVLFFILSEFLINVGLQSSYKDMEAKNEISQVEITEAQSTLVNGKIKGIIKNSEEEYLTGKFVKLDFYSERDNLVGTKYIPIQTADVTTTQEINAYFELHDVTSYDISIVDTKPEGELEIDLLPEELKKPKIILLTAITLSMFW